jgi:hypothetical protein
MTMTGERIVIAGAGALGSQIAMHLALPDREFLIIDDDRVEEENLLTTVYSRQHVGAMKAVVLAELLWRKCRCKSQTCTQTLTSRSRVIMPLPAVLVDTFDNTEARELTRHGFTVHVGVSENRTGSVVWDKFYAVPGGPPRGQNPICTHELGRPILRFTAAIAAGAIEEFLETGKQTCYVCTEDMRVLR